jgi:type IV pilus assembly protein PilV
MFKACQKGGEKRKEGGAVLLEALIAILIFSIGILAIVALQANMLQATGDANYRAQATFVAQQRLSDIWNDQQAINLSCGAVDIDIADSSGLPGGTMSTICGCDGRADCYTVTVGWTQPGSGTAHSVVTRAYVTRDN